MVNKSIAVSVIVIILVMGVYLSSTAKGREQWSKLKTHCGCPCPVCRLKLKLRKIIEDHVWWTRQVIVSALANLPDLSAALARLKKNQTDIARAVSGKKEAVFREQKALWDEHIDVAVEVVQAAAKDKAASDSDTKITLDLAIKKWRQNASSIAKALVKLKPKRLSYEPLNKMLQTHLDTLTNEVLARLNQNWEEDVKTQDIVKDHMLTFADTLAVAFA